ncbi:hypothetical protein MEBOL_001707 [Melittangium boletus DSM 14713]|uniref:Uncharacterized protein n=1 Tax=Melittangium boletus DSM 14713 TaxID=1294270 RepID=A0A250IAT6_9BACT|nr:hypothetical protein MEBOL_001707 [Melittangium boletus DSM 14713]
MGLGVSLDAHGGGTHNGDAGLARMKSSRVWTDSSVTRGSYLYGTTVPPRWAESRSTRRVSL